MDNNVNSSYFKKSFIFKVNRWEEWSSGQCISQGNIDLYINANDLGEKIEFIIDGDTKDLRVKKVSCFSYDISYVSETNNNPSYSTFISNAPSIPGRISYNTPLRNDVYNEQFITELHFRNQNIAFIRFCFEGRILEFYGNVVDRKYSENYTDYNESYINNSDFDNHKSNSNVQNSDKKFYETILEIYLDVLKQFGNFKGRTRRKDYYIFVLSNIALFMILAILSVMTLSISEYLSMVISFINFPLIIGFFVPLPALIVRRLHDVGKSGIFTLIALIPIFGKFWLIAVLGKEGESGSNQYGEDPKKVDFE